MNEADDAPWRCDCAVCSQDRRLSIVAQREIREAQRKRRLRRLANKEKHET